METRRKAKGSTDHRTIAIAVVFCMLFAATIARLFYLQVVRGDGYRAVAANQHSLLRRLTPVRGEIKLVDPASGEAVPVATNVKHVLLYAVPSEVVNPQLTAASLSTLLQLPAPDLAQRLQNTSSRYVVIKKNLSQTEQDQVKQLGLAGLYYDSEDTRYYPEGSLLSHVLGYVGYKDTEREGQYGLERYFQKALAGKSGTVAVSQDGHGNDIGSQELAQEDGVTLVLTVDRAVQRKAEEVIERTVREHGAQSGSVIIVSPKTGAVIAMAGYPNFNPNEYSKVGSLRDFANEATTGNYEPGSIFKPLTMAAAVEEGQVTPTTTYVDKGEIKVDEFTIKNSDGKAHGVQTMTQVLEESLNTGAIFAKEQIGNKKFLEYLKNFGFGQPTGIELPEAKGSLDNLRLNIEVNYDTASFGQGITVTPIQFIQAFSAFSNGGKMLRPYLVAEKIFADGRTEQTEPTVVRTVFSKQTADTITSMLVGVVENGHGKKAGVPGYYIAGKTGTAQIGSQNGKGYLEGVTIGSFAGYGPVEDPRFLMLVRVDRPAGVKFAEVTAAPAFGELAAFMLRYYNIPPTRK